MPTPRFLRPLLAAIAAALLATGGVAVAQEATPPPTPRAAAYPVSIHRGTCPDPVPQPIGPTFDTEPVGRDADAELVGASAEPPVLVASTMLEGTLADYTATPHVVAVHASAENYGEIVACGEIAGYADDGQLVFALRGVNGANVSGLAILDDEPTFLDEALKELDLGLGELSLTVFVIPADEEGTGA